MFSPFDATRGLTRPALSDIFGLMLDVEAFAILEVDGDLAVPDGETLGRWALEWLEKERPGELGMLEEEPVILVIRGDLTVDGPLVVGSVPSEPEGRFFLLVEGDLTAKDLLLGPYCHLGVGGTLRTRVLSCMGSDGATAWVGEHAEVAWFHRGQDIHHLPGFDGVLVNRNPEIDDAYTGWYAFHPLTEALDAGKSVLRQRPDTVPEGAWWDVGDSEWVLGERDAEGRLQGEVRYWRADGTYMAFCGHVDGVPHGPGGRFHESGEPSQVLTYANGKLHGTRTWTSIEGPTTENTRPPGVSEKVMRSEMDYDHGNVTAVRHYSIDGERLNADGSPLPVAPPGLPEGVWYDEREKRWKHGEANGDGSLRGPWHIWRVDGSRYAEMLYGEDGAVQWLREWHPDGTEALHLDFVGEKGTYHRGPETTDCTPVELPEGAADVTFRLRVVNAKSGLHWKIDQEYRATDGTPLTEEGHVIRQPHPDAEPVYRGSWSRTNRWRQREETAGGRVERFWQQDGTPAFTATYEGDALVALDTFREDGTRVEERFRPGEDGPLHTGLVLEGGGGRMEVEYASTGAVRAIVVEADGASVRNELSVDGLDPKDFAAWFDAGLGKLEAAGLDVEVDTFDIGGSEVEVLDFYVQGVQLFGNHGGDYAILVTGGDRHRGKVFINYHDEDVYMMHEEFDEDIRDHLSMMDVDPDEADHDTIVENLPMFENELASDLADLATRFRAGSSTFRTDAYAEYRPLR